MPKIKLEDDEFDENRIIAINGKMGLDSRKSILHLLESYMGNREKPILLLLNTTGGRSSSELEVLCNYAHPKPKLFTYAYEKCMSFGVIAMQYGIKRLSDSDTKFMFHPIKNPDTGKIADLGYGLTIVFYNALASRCGVSVNKILEDFKSDVYMTSEQAVNYGIIDKIISIPEELKIIAEQRAAE
ncbi:MAG: ATP-dependent Clp protease proteolytic subunit, partial [archaeon]